MTKKHFIALADIIRSINEDEEGDHDTYFHSSQIERLADFCESQNPRFDRDRWLKYIAGTHGQNGGKLK